MEIFFKLIESVGGLLTSLLAIIVFFKMVILPFFIKLEVELTKDLFFRLTDLGESFFSKIIVYSPINIQITKCSFELKSQKINTQETSYNCKAEKFGSVERVTINQFSLPSFYLPKSSSEFLLKPSDSKELLIQCSITGSKENITKATQKLHNNYINLSKSAEKELQKEKFNSALDKCSTDILSNIKVESGAHILVCKINYKYRHFFIPIKKKTESRINITITQKSFNRYKNQDIIKNYLCDCLMVLNPKNSNMNIRFPEINVTTD